ncbi:hypothetical protein SAMN04488570_0749 [Nocardioides scoriae]|uniref:Glycosyl transferase family 2 n=1 Tax=Nocardioides scoriae TaxID=642780 RepID=A0A1H1N352_9ACTN|nr:hypothetical protein SAMN04488570_0749 [Nocardioides scoriae]
MVVPARDEAALLPGMLASLDLAVRALARTAGPGSRRPVAVAATVVLDSCRDGSGEAVARAALAMPWLDSVTVALGRVGSVRAAGVEHARATAAGTPAGDLWVATTDADTRVPVDWLLGHVAAARAGVELLTGTVRPDELLVASQRRAWLAQHDLVEGHLHVHGANLGFTLAAYDAVGGFGALATGEDVDLVERLRRHGARSRATAAIPVTTSARLDGRAPAGFAAYLAEL